MAMSEIPRECIEGECIECIECVECIEGREEIMDWGRVSYEL